MDALDDSSSVDNTCRLTFASNAVDRHSSNAIVHNIAGFVADDPSLSLIVDALNSPVYGTFAYRDYYRCKSSGEKNELNYLWTICYSRRYPFAAQNILYSFYCQQ